MIPLGHDISPLAAIVVIKDLTGTEMYRYEMAQVVNGTPIQQFNLKGGILERGINSDHGSLIFDIEDNAEELTDKDILSFPSKLKHGWEVELYLGKTPSTVNLWYRGIIDLDKTIKQTKTNTISITTHGYGIITASRYSSISRSQLKLSDGISPDETDLTTTISQLFKDVLLDIDHLESKTLGLLDLIPSEVDDIPLSLGEFHKNLVTIGSILEELAQMGGAVWGVNPDKTVFLHQRHSKDSEFLITNDVDTPSLITTNWNQEKLAFFKSAPLIRNDSTQNSAVTSLIAIGSQRQVVDYDNIVSDLPLDLSIENYAFPFSPQKDNVSQISIFFVRSGPITSNLKVSIVGTDDLGAPNFSDLRETKIIPHELLEKLLAPPVIERNIKIKFNKIPVSKDETLFVVIEQSSNMTFLTIEYDSTTGPGWYESSDLENWTLTTPGKARFTTYQSKTVKIIGQNTTTQKNLRPKEHIITLPDQPDEDTNLAIFESALESLSKIISNYDPILITPTTLPLKLGQTLKFIDVNSGFDRQLDLVGYSLKFNAYDKDNLGATEIKLDLQETYI